MVRSSCKVAALAVLTCVLLLGFAGAANAGSWPDVDSSVLTSYGLTADQLSQVSDGFPDGTWQPWRSITRAQFAKMAVTAFGLDLTAPTTPSFSDVAADDYFYPYIEAVHAAGLMNGVGERLFAPGAPLTREQAVAVVARKVAADEGFDLAAMTESDMMAALEGFAGASAISPGLRGEMAFAVGRLLVKGNAGRDLMPKALVSRVAAAALVVRAMGPQFLLDVDDDGAAVTVRTGDVITVVVKGNPTTGYTWTAALSEADAAILEQMGDPAYVPDSDLIGSGGTFVFRFRAVAAGEAVLMLTYARPWESVPPLETFSVVISVADAPLEGTSWKLESWSVSAVDPAEFEQTATFADGKVGGKAVVNSYSAPYSIGANGRLWVGEITRTLMAGSEQEMRAEDTYLGLLGQARAFRLTDGSLTLLDANMNELLIFQPVG